MLVSCASCLDTVAVSCASCLVACRARPRRCSRVAASVSAASVSAGVLAGMSHLGSCARSHVPSRQLAVLALILDLTTGVSALAFCRTSVSLVVAQTSGYLRVIRSPSLPLPSSPHTPHHLTPHHLTPHHLTHLTTPLPHHPPVYICIYVCVYIVGC